MTAAPYERCAEVAPALRRLERHMLAQGDRRARFLATYWITTEAMVRHLGENYFEDPEYVSTAVVRFAEYYREALHAYAEGRRDEVPVVWLRAHDAALHGRLSQHQIMLLGIAAHIRDLAYAVADLYVPADHERQQRDFLRVNRVVGEVIDATQDHLARHHDREFARLDALAMRFDEHDFNRWLVMVRNDAWRLGVHLARAQTPEEREAARADIEQSFLVRSVGIAKAPLRTLLAEH